MSTPVRLQPTVVQCPFVPQRKTARQGRGSSIVSIVIPLDSRIAGGQPGA